MEAPQNPEENKTTSESVKKTVSRLVGSLKVFLADLLDIRHNTDQPATIQGIKDDIAFRGHNSWILVCSIFIASVGLNANSAAVVIGAMLISPLMGPILGIGMGVAMNDIDTLRRSLKNVGVMAGLSILTAFLFFRFFPLRDESSELLARTAPDIRDVLIAFFGGLALVIARAKRGTIASVIFGVAIATALMPPLCTVGFGLAIGNMEYAGGALYLFIINSLFIGLATFLALKILRFPMVQYADSLRRRWIARIASLLAVLAMIPAGYTFFNVWRKSTFKNQAKQFITETIASYQFSGQGRFLDHFTSIEYNKNTPSIELFFMGDEVIPDNVIKTWNAQKLRYPRLKNTELKIIQGAKSDAEERLKYVNELYEAKKTELANKDERIKLLEAELEKLSKAASMQIPFDEWSKEAKINYETIERLSFSYRITTNFDRIDTIPTFSVKWKADASEAQISENMKKLIAWLRLKFKGNNLQVIREE